MKIRDGKQIGQEPAVYSTFVNIPIASIVVIPKSTVRNRIDTSVEYQ